MKRFSLQNIKDSLFNYFSMNERNSDEEIYKEINENVSFRGGNLWVLIFAIFMASLGLNVDSTAVIIGAMLISPLMGPIIGIGHSVGVNDFALLKKSFKNYIVASIISILTAAIYFIISPYNGVQSELLARTTPTLYDVFIATFGGAAGIVALSKGGKGTVIPGVAIATALMPPLCTAGYGIAHWNSKFFLGAIYLYFINCVFIALATYIGTRMMKFKYKVFIKKKSYLRVRKYIIGLVIITIVPAIYMTIKIVRDSYFNTNLKNFIAKEIKYSGTQIVHQNVNKTDKVLEIVAVGREIPDEHIEKAQNALIDYNLGSYKLQIIQGNQSDSILKLNSELISLETKASDKDKTIQEQAKEIIALEDKLQSLERYNSLSAELIAEVKIFFDQVYSINLNSVTENSVDGKSKVFIQAVVTVNEGASMSEKETSQLKELISAKCNYGVEKKSIVPVKVLVINKSK